MELMKTRNLRYGYNKHMVLDGVDVEIRRGEILGILGLNGCGKTTLLRNLNRNLSPNSGCVMLDGSDIAEMTKKDIAKRVAVVPQTNEINFAFTVRDIVSMGRMPFQGMMSGCSTEDEKIIDRALEQTGLTKYADRDISGMSGGERQRVIIARAIAQTPDVLLMDEPTLHLDINMQFEVLDLVKELSIKNNLTVGIVSHDLPMVARYCDRMILIKDHIIYAEGKPEDVLTPENMREVFGIDACFEVDERGMNTVRLYGAYRPEREDH